jgi:hypothetical protein
MLPDTGGQSAHDGSLRTCRPPPSPAGQRVTRRKGAGPCLLPLFTRCAIPAAMAGRPFKRARLANGRSRHNQTGRMNPEFLPDQIEFLFSLKRKPTANYERLLSGARTLRTAPSRSASRCGCRSS